MLNGLPWKWTEMILLFWGLLPSTAFQTLVYYKGYSFSSKGFLPISSVQSLSRVKLFATPWTIWKGKKRGHWKMSLPGQKVSSMLLGKSGGQLLVAPERMKWMGQSGIDAVVGVSGGESKVWCYKDQYCKGTWNVRSMNQGKLDLVNKRWQDWTSTSLGISKLKWMRMGVFNWDDHFIYYCG